jgi:hypothetical protein
MSYTIKMIYSKPNNLIVLNFQQSDMTTLIDSYFDQGKILQKPVKTVSGLTETYTTVFKDETSYFEFKNETATSSHVENRLNFCNDNLVSWSMETP